MKKILLFLMVILVTGCGKTKLNDVVSSFEKSINKAKSYEIKGTMEILSDEDNFTYDIIVLYKETDNYKVTLINKTNNHEQIILRNEDGVYVVTPSLNKSFKFQSEWPYNSSQSYIPKSIIKDINRDNEAIFKETENGFIITCEVDYPNNDTLTYEKIEFNKNKELKKVSVYDSNDTVRMIVDFVNIDYNKKIDDKEFELTNSLDENCCDETTASIDSIIFPLYIPSETYLQTKETIETDTGNRTILTFSGNKSFILVEEPVSVTKENELIPVYGDPLILNDTIGALSANSFTWRSNNVEFYLTSNNLTENEMLTIASSLNADTLSVGK